MTVHNGLVTSRRNPANDYTLTAWAGTGCLQMCFLDRAGVSRVLRSSMDDDRCDSVSVSRTFGDRHVLTVSRAIKGCGGYRDPEGQVHGWVSYGPGRVDGIPHHDDMFGADGQFLPGWGYADAEFAARAAAAKQAAIAKLSETEEGRELLASWGVAA